MTGARAAARPALLLALGLLLFAAAGGPRAASLRYCDRPAPASAAQQDRLLRLGALVKAELEASGQAIALIARSGLDLSRFAMRYSHAGVSLKASENAPWSVRQLYYACDERRPRLFDQGMAGFLLGTDDPAIGYISVVLLPAEAAAPLERVALDRRLALRLLSGNYSANAYAFDTQHQNCNQWLLELLASAWGAADTTDSEARAEAQRWLAAQGYEPSVFEVGNPLLMWAGAFVPWLHNADHPVADLEAARYRVTMPASIEAFVRQRLPGARRIEFCHNERHAVIHRGWEPIAAGCEPAPGDTVVQLR